MKTNAFFCLFFLLLGTAVNSQTTPPEVRQQIVRTMTERNAPTTGHRFNPEEWRLDSTHAITLTGSAWEPATRQYYFYDAENLLVKDSTIFWYTNQAVPAFKVTR